MDKGECSSQQNKKRVKRSVTGRFTIVKGRAAPTMVSRDQVQGKSMDFDPDRAAVPRIVRISCEDRVHNTVDPAGLMGMGG